MDPVSNTGRSITKLQLSPRLLGKLCLELRNVLVCLVRFCLYCPHTLFKVGSDGKTPRERITGRVFRRPLVPFGQKVLYEIRCRRVPKIDGTMNDVGVASCRV